ncbi:MAG: type II toxin-antitoxin system Phd/YefM family antitoxin [Gammaproteobacteria bacterium]|nr:type II toxin-antitoxin system Phd/YefM family antitoxin [Gammaproteobacteria bacterium]MCF6259478.1 type II toxin-antitoxin system Phd/YefM family antitoxin [Gammaproteobacteria bacterium]
MKNNTWQLQEAKSKFSQLVEDAMNKEPQIVTKHGDKAVVVLSFEEYIKITKPQTDLIRFLRESPLAKVTLEATRSKDIPRDISL